MDASDPIHAYILDLLKLNRLFGEKPPEIINIAGDGSDRRFFRVLRGEDLPSLVFVFPGSDSPDGLRESAAVNFIGRHLLNKGINVAQIFAYDSENGAIVMEDLGDLHLATYAQSCLKSHQPASVAFTWPSELMMIYRKVLEQLFLLQVKGYEGFNFDYCWQTPVYDVELMLTRESGYFAQAFYRSYLGEAEIPQGVDEEFVALANRVAEEPNHFLMHRDFQSRNIMIVDGKPRIIDYQGARRGPVGYDLASLLIDPYVHVPAEVGMTLRNEYARKLAEKKILDPEKFIKGYYHIALQRNLQILGAFAFLSKQKGKMYFAQFIPRAIERLAGHLSSRPRCPYPRLENLVIKLHNMVKFQNNLSPEPTVS